MISSKRFIISGMAVLLILSPGRAASWFENKDEGGILRADGPHLSQPFRFDTAANGALETRLTEITAIIASHCQARTEVTALCLWPQAVQELKVTGAQLTKESFDGSKMALTLAARLHPLNLRARYAQGNGFEATYARFLIARRLVRELWPAVKEAERHLGLDLSLMDDWIVPAMSAVTPWSMLLNLSRVYSCSGGTGCAEKHRIIYVLKRVSEAIEGDSQWVAQIQAAKDATSGFRDAQVDFLYRQVLQTLNGDTNGNLLVFTGSPDFLNLDVIDAASYLSSVAREAMLPPHELMNFSGHACQDLNQTLELARTERSTPWAKEVRGNFTCSLSSGRLISAAGPAMRDLSAKRLVWKFNFYQLRLMIAVLFDGLRSLEERELKTRQTHEILTDVEAVRRAVVKIQEVSVRSSETERLKPQMEMLNQYLWDSLDEASALVQE